MEHANVTRLPTRQASQPEPVPINAVATLVAAIDRALGDKWSFDIVHHETVGDETVVFTKLVVDGRYRIGIGGTTEKGTLVHRLNAAAIDALARAAEWMGITVDVMPDVRSDPNPAVQEPVAEAANGARITRKQLDYLYSLARDRQITRDRLAARCLADFKKRPEYLTKNEASRIIEALKEVTP